MNQKKSLYKSISLVAVATVSLLLIPLIAMQFSADVLWTHSDFIFAGGLLFGTGLAYVLISRTSKNTIYRINVGFSLLSGLFLIWVNLAVGIIGSENNPINLLYFLVIFTGVIGAFISRFRPKGLSYTMFTAAGVTALIAVIALFNGAQNMPYSSVYEIIAVNAFFITLFVIPGTLFRYSDMNEANIDKGT